jgi:hypothetical protein
MKCTALTLGLRRGLIAALTLAAPALAGEGAEPACTSGHLTEFDVPQAATVPSPVCGSTCGTQPLGNNSLGAIVGSYTDPDVVPHGFLRTPRGEIISFDAPGAGLGAQLDQGTVAYTLNERGWIVGQFEDPNYAFHGFIRLEHQPRGNNGRYLPRQQLRRAWLHPLAVGPHHEH